MTLLVGAVSASELRVDQAAATTRRAPRGRTAVRGGTAGALAEDRLSVTDGILELL